MFLPLKRIREIVLIVYMINNIAPPTATVFKLNIEESEIDHPKIIKKKVLITNADSPVITLKSAKTLVTFSWSISFIKPPLKNSL